jgi:hypothetical protein
MPATAIWNIEGTEVTTGASPSARLVYTVTGATDENDALAAVASTAPATYNGMPRSSRSAETIDASTFVVSVTYQPGRFESAASALVRYEFDTTGGSEQAFVALSTINTYAAPGAGTAPDMKGGINVTNDGPQGVSRAVPVYNFSETHTIAAAAMTAGYKATIFGLTGKVNNATYKGFAAGEVLFLGARGASNANGDFEITFSFSALPNVSGATFGPFTGVTKKGWDYLWVYSEEEEDATAKRVVKRPVAAYVVQVFPYANLSGLGI